MKLGARAAGTERRVVDVGVTEASGDSGELLTCFGERLKTVKRRFRESAVRHQRKLAAPGADVHDRPEVSRERDSVMLHGRRHPMPQRSAVGRLPSHGSELPELPQQLTPSGCPCRVVHAREPDLHQIRFVSAGRAIILCNVEQIRHRHQPSVVLPAMVNIREPERPPLRFHAARRSWRMLVVGYFERGNLGDDAMREGLGGFLLAECPEIEVRYLPLPAWRRADLHYSAELIRGLRWAGIVLLAGGSHFHDHYGRRSFRILASHWLLFGIARLLGTSVGYAGIGVGPLSTRYGRRLVGRLLALSAAVLVRDQRSARTAHELASHIPLVYGFDSASLLPAATSRTAPEDHVRVGVSITPYFSVFEQDAGQDALVTSSLAVAVKELSCGRSLSVGVFPFNQRGFASDLAVSNHLIEALSDSVFAQVEACETPKDTLRRFSSLAGLLVTRYHAALLGYLAGVPMIMVAYEEKCLALAEEIGFPAQAILQPADLLQPEVVHTTLERLLSDPASFRATLPVVEAAERTATGLREFTRLLLKPTVTPAR